MLGAAAAEHDGDTWCGGRARRLVRSVAADSIGWSVIGTDTTAALVAAALVILGRMTEPPDVPLSPATIAVAAGRPPRQPDGPHEPADRDGLDLPRRRRRRLRPLRQPHVGDVRDGRRRARGRRGDVVRLRHGGRGRRARPRAGRRHGRASPDAYYGTLAMLERLRVARAADGAPGRPHRHRAAAAPVRGATCCGWRAPRTRCCGSSTCRRAGRRARAAGVLSAVDNTFTTPIVQRPLEMGADVVVHSATKYLSGHSDLLMGVAVARDAVIAERLVAYRSLQGACPGAVEAWLALRGLRTLHAAAGARAGQRARRWPTAWRGTRGSPAVHFPRVAAPWSAWCWTATSRPRTASRRRRGCGCTRPASAGSSRAWNGAGAGRARAARCPRRCCGCPSASRTSRTSGADL